MAITNAQQFKQLVNPPMEGKKRPGYRGEGGYQGGATNQGGAGNPGGNTGGNGNDRGRDRDFQQRGMSKADYDKAVSRETLDKILVLNQIFFLDFKIKHKI